VNREDHPQSQPAKKEIETRSRSTDSAIDISCCRHGAYPPETKSQNYYHEIAKSSNEMRLPGFFMGFATPGFLPPPLNKGKVL